jgi:2-methylisocitrate lyase-like PEP mutase family enzyme
VSRSARFRELLKTPPFICMGAHDAVTAKLAEQAGAPAIYVSGFAASAIVAGQPDFGVLTQTEMFEHIRRICRVTTIPVFADADTGYGGVLEAQRTMRLWEESGASVLHLEDQAMPKKCGHFAGKQLIPPEEMRQKLRAMLEARQDPDFFIVARTDSRAVAGFDEAISRVNEALANGADMAFVEAPQTLEELAAVPKRVNGPCLLNVVWGGKTPMLDMCDAAALGFKLAIVPALLLKASIGACDGALAALKATGAYPAPPGGMTVRDVFNRAGGRDWDALQTRFR